MRSLTVVLVVVGVFAGLCRAADAPPRYKLPVGRVLHYESASRDAGDLVRLRSSGAARLLVLAQNADGSNRVLVEQSSRSDGRDERTSLAAFDVTPDGKATPVGGAETRVGIYNVLPMLPADVAEATASWTSPVGWDSSVTTYTGRFSPEPKVFKFSSVEDGPISKIYLFTRTLEFEFDRAKGMVTKCTGESSQKHGFDMKSTSTTTLAREETLDPEKAAALAKDYAALFESDDKRVKLLSRIQEEPEQVAKLISEADAVTTEAAKRVTEPEVAAQFERRVKENAEAAKYLIERANKLAAVLNKPGAEWSSTDLEGHAWDSEKLKGKIVVMDFWYRGCGWCMYAMPQVKQLAADYKDRGVVVLGMNTDREEKNAKFVVATLGLTYPQIRAEGLPPKFGVQGFPTLIVIDQAGVVRGFHVGYSKDLRETVGKQINALLSAKTPA